MYYEKKEVKCYLIYRKKYQQVAVRLIINRKKTEHKLFEWPQEYWDAECRMIRPRGAQDKEFHTFIEKILELQRELMDIAQNSSSAKEAGIKAHRRTISLSTLGELWLKSRILRESTRQQYESLQKQVCDILGDLNVNDISIKQLSLLDHSLLEKKPSTAKKYHAYLKGLLRYAVKKNWIDRSPYNEFTRMKRDSEEKDLELQTSHIATIRRIAHQMDGNFAKAARLLLLQCYTGTRYSDACVLTKASFTKGYYISQKTQTRVALNTLADTDRLFESLPIEIPYTTYVYYLKFIGERLNINITSHDGRRLFATLLMSSCNDLSIVQKALGHKSMQTTEGYIKTSEQKVKKAIEQMTQLFGDTDDNLQ